MIDDYCYHKKNENGEEVSTNVLRNKYDLRYDFLLEEVERRLTSLRLLEIYTDKPIKGNFDFKHLQDIHKYIFQDLYDWAGQTRNCNIEKENSLFCDFQNINSYAKDIFIKLQRNKYFIDLPDEDKIVKLADLFSDINALHPFREGNGRTQREFVEDLARVNGLDIKITSISPDKMIKASIYGCYGINDLLYELFKEQTNNLSIDEQLYNIDKYCTPELAKKLKNILEQNKSKSR